MTDAQFVGNVMLLEMVTGMLLLLAYCVIADKRDAKHQARRVKKFARFHEPSEFADEMKASELDVWLHSGATYKFNDGLTAAQMESWHNATNAILRDLRKEKNNG